MRFTNEPLGWAVSGNFFFPPFRAGLDIARFDFGVDLAMTITFR